MAVTSEYQPIRLKGDGSTARFDFTFRILAPTDLQVYVGNTLKELGTHYDVKSDVHLPGGSGYDWRDGGYVQFNVDEIPAENVDVTIHRVIPILQLLDLEEGGPLPPEMLESAFDRMIYIAQQLSNAINRCLSFPVYAEYDFDPTVPEPKAYAVLGVSADGKSFHMYDEYVLKIQYSPNLEDWYDESSLERSDRYVRLSINDGQTWGSPIDLNGLQNAMVTQALAYKNAAADSAAEAAASALEAQEAATSASASASNAEAYATVAQDAKEDVEASAASAALSALNAATSASSAQASATTAQNAKTDAQAAASSASLSASEALGYRNAAEGFALTAQASAEGIQEAEESARESATLANNAKLAAQVAAEEAQAHSSDAAAYAFYAQTEAESAENAKTAAETAKADAEAAKSLAEASSLDAASSASAAQSAKIDAQLASAAARESEIAANTYKTAAEASSAAAQTAAANANTYKADAQQAAAVAQDSASAAFGAAAPAWSASSTYNFPDVVAYTDGHTYRCKGTNVGSDNPPVIDEAENSAYWTKLTLAYGSSAFDYDENNDLMPALTILLPLTGPFVLDELYDLMPA